MRARDQADIVQLSKIRIKEPLRAALERDAATRGMTLNAAIADRLERSFDRERTFREALTSLLGGPRTEAILLTLAISANRGEAHIGDGWLDDYATFHTVMNDWRETLDDIPRPPMPEEIKSQVAMVSRLVRTLEPGQEIEQSQPQHWRRIAEFVAASLVNRVDPETAAELRRVIASTAKAAPEGDEPAD